MPRLRRYRKFMCLVALGLVFVVVALWHGYDARRRAAMVDAARSLGGRVNSLPFLWTEELRIDFDKAPSPEVMCRELAMLNHPGPFRSVTVSVHARDFDPDEVKHLRTCLYQCTVIGVEDAD